MLHSAIRYHTNNMAMKCLRRDTFIYDNNIFTLQYVI